MLEFGARFIQPSSNHALHSLSRHGCLDAANHLRLYPLGGLLLYALPLRELILGAAGGEKQVEASLNYCVWYKCAILSGGGYKRMDVRLERETDDMLGQKCFDWNLALASCTGSGLTFQRHPA